MGTADDINQELDDISESLVAKTCATCRHFYPYKDDSGKGGKCNSERIASGSGGHPVTDKILMTYGGFDGYGDYMHVSPEFGCILHEKKVT